MSRDLTKYNYQDLVDRMTDNLSEKEGWGDAYDSSMGQTLIQMVADATDILHYMQERRSRESYLKTAKLPSSIRALAGERGYRPRRNVSSSGFLKIGLYDAAGNQLSPQGTVFIPRYTKFFYDDVTFVNKEDIYITTDTPEVEFEVMEGTPQVETYNPVGTSFFGQNGYILYTDYIDIEENSVVIKDEDDDEWIDIRSNPLTSSYKGALSFVGSSDKYYDIKISVDGLRVIFGDGKFGARPQSELTVEWVKSSGDDINIITTGLAFKLQQNTLTDDINVTPPNIYYYKIENITPIRGGLAGESIETIRLKAPEYFKTGDRAVTRQDFDFWLVRSGIGGIVDVNSYGEQELGLNIYRMNQAYCSYLTSTGDDMTTEQLEDAREFIDTYKVGIPHITFVPADKLYFQYNLQIARDRGLRVSNSEVYQYVRQQIANLFKFEEGSINRPVYFSEMIEFLHNLTITRDGIEQKIARYVTLESNVVYPVTIEDAGDRFVQLPPRFLNNKFDDDQLLENSAIVVDPDYLEWDDETGEIVPLITNGQLESSIDYSNATITLPTSLSFGSYYIMYKEDEHNNIKPNERSVVAVLNPKEKFEDTTETLSTIEFI